MEWFNKYYEGYEPNPEVIGKINDRLSDYEVVIFFGSWCGDSKREVPRFLKVLDAVSFPDNQLSLIAVSNADSLKKQSPDGSERQQEIYRVPTFILKRNGVEMNRIVEYPVTSLERDLLQIMSGSEYVPNYRSFPMLTQWLREGLLSDDNVSYRGLANQVRSTIATEGELHAVAAVLVGRGLEKEAVQLLRMNAYLHPESARRKVALARTLHDLGEHEEAARNLKKALELNDDPRRQDTILALWDRIRESQSAESAMDDENSEDEE